MDIRYTPQEIEDKWYAKWEETGSFKPQGEGKPFTIVIPPPNVTGALHMGHALNNTLQDVLIRQKRLQGFKTLWQPGMDHAGIATQSVVEKQIAKDNLVRQDLGREKFIEKVWEWKEAYGGKIINQLKKLGCSCDWSRERFTMDEGLSKAVRKVFVKYHKEGLIYYGYRLINWCPQLQTALADEEVETKETPGHMWSLKYPLADDPSQFIIVSTTRPETLFGDSAVAVNKDDPRYKDLIGKKVVLPFINREIPIITDEHADPEKGSGAVKITPAHDFNDFEVGKRHNLEQIVVLNKDATLNHHCGKFKGMDRFEARKQIVKELEAMGQLDKIEDQNIPIPHCYRSGDVIEPYLMGQWFVKMKPLAEPALASVREGRTQFIPERYSKTYFDWLDQFRDWCISRQIWWGHQIPAWYVVSETKGKRISETPVIVALSEEDALKQAQEKFGSEVKLIQEEDVLDTWFSSALWPFSTQGWPEQTDDLSTHYPTDVLITARDIIYFWVARMMFSGLKHLGKEPFHTVYIHGTILDEKGQRMSKSKGNGIDPLEMIAQYGADAVRFSLLTLTSEGQDIRLSPSKFEMGRNFANKIWNAVRFVLTQCADHKSELHNQHLTLADKWILSRTNQLIEMVDESLDKYRFSDACNALYQFLWNDFCSRYLEFNKKRLMDNASEQDKETVVYVFNYVLQSAITLLHPFMPYLTEEINEQLGHKSLLITASWPQVKKDFDFTSERNDFERALGIVDGIRSIRGSYAISPSTQLNVVLNLDDPSSLSENQRTVVENLENLESLTLGNKPNFSASSIFPGGQAFVVLEGILDKEAEKGKMEKELLKAKKFVMGLEKKLSNERFVANAPEQVIALEKEKLATQKSKIQKLEITLKELKA